jgi:hypothetical protein
VGFLKKNGRAKRVVMESIKAGNLEAWGTKLVVRKPSPKKRRGQFRVNVTTGRE